MADSAMAGSAMPSLPGYNPATASATAPTMLAIALWRRSILRASGIHLSRVGLIL